MDMPRPGSDPDVAIDKVARDGREYLLAGLLVALQLLGQPRRLRRRSTPEEKHLGVGALGLGFVWDC